MVNVSRFTLRTEPDAAREARARVKALNGLPRQVVANAGLVVSEMVTNAVQHAGLRPGDAIELTLRTDDERLVIEVDDGDGFSADGRPPVRRARNGGFGLRLLDALCEHWEADSGVVSASLRIHGG